jgi:hypothetical protein
MFGGCGTALNDRLLSSLPVLSIRHLRLFLPLLEQSSPPLRQGTSKDISRGLNPKWSRRPTAADHLPTSSSTTLFVIEPALWLPERARSDSISRVCNFKKPGKKCILKKETGAAFDRSAARLVEAT